MKGWILVPYNNKHLFEYTSILVFKTKKALLDYYNGAIGESETIKRIEVKL